MKVFSLLPTCFAATLFILPAGLSAQGAGNAGAGEGGEPLREQRRAARLERFDSNNDGKLDDAERAAAKAAAQKKRGDRAGRGHERALKAFDADKNGTLDEAERAAAFDALSTRPRMIKRFDENGDGKLDAVEKEAAREAFERRGRGRNQQG